MHRIRLEHVTGVAVLTAEGELDAYSAPALTETLEELRRSGEERFAADLSRVSFMDSTALGLLVRAVRELSERGGKARVVLPTTMARRIFEITTLDRVLPVASSRAAALAELAGEEGLARGSGPRSR